MLPCLKKLLVIAGLASLACSANATPFTFQFNMPNWDFTTDASTFGTGSILSITADNGNNTSVSQVFKNSQILQISLSAVGGTFGHTWTNLALFGAPDSYLSTNSAGAARLDLLASFVQSAVAGFDAGNFFQIARITPDGGFTSYYLQGSSGSAMYLPQDAQSGKFTGFVVTGAENNVPEPASWALAGLGLAGLGFAGKRRARKAD